MLLIISPAKKLNGKSKNTFKNQSSAEFIKESKSLVSVLKKFKPEDLSTLMNISPKLGELNYERYLKWEYPFESEEAGPAVTMFQGDVYQGLQAEKFSDEEADFAQDNLRILSGLYGVLKPFDIILPYRLEMGTKLKTKQAKDLYEFWEDKIRNNIQETLNKKGNILVNLASKEYFKSVKSKHLNAEIITPSFKEYKDGSYKMVSFFAKKARGMMCRYIISNRITNHTDIKGFDYENYSFNHELSNEKEYVFSR